MAQMMTNNDTIINSTTTDQADRSVSLINGSSSGLMFEELPDDYNDQSAGIEIIHPDSVEEQEDDIPTLSSDLDVAAEPDSTIARRLQQLRCDDDDNPPPPREGRDQVKRKWKTGFSKRTHSQSADEEAEEGQIESPVRRKLRPRRMRRRIGSPNESDWVEEFSDGSVYSVSASRPASGIWDDGVVGKSDAMAQSGNAMDVDS